ncbi:cyclic nucleotide-binding domain-containing protein [Phytohabitans suffuscus]|uniref:Cyclic nucleotide-binding domain-containing protein n=1 Tax=Phytohabitans suffuscus TaxID=624315 RepID=A0A6F8YCV3_9ACTN|nr:cyclic nucleotide-binding domain-containing protein [Phytohabitans suffuscus]BCB83932.1 hypothetical protein Psuf_012450 [Phytohabitans suffuscus]
MPDAPAPEPRDVLVVSCDIVGHSSEQQHEKQLSRVTGINAVVAQTIMAPVPAIWASGGDGGHVIFPEADAAAAAEAALDLITRFLEWSTRDQVGLRITAHAGKVSQLVGADGRVQVVGDGINVAGWLLTRGGPSAVVVSDAFRRRLEPHGPWPGIQFHEPRMLRDKTKTDQQLWRMSVKGFDSSWYAPAQGDRARLRERRGWELMYYAKRILQVNKTDQEALEALARLRRLDLVYTTPGGEPEVNPFFEYLQPSMLREVVESAQLVERQYNEVICRLGDEGDTMFVILSGRVGVYKMRGRDGARPVEPHFSHQEGDVVGELAFALGRHRTADLVAMTPVVLLSFHYNDIAQRLKDKADDGDRAAALALATIQSFISRRVLEYLSQEVDFLVGPDGTGPLALPAESMADPLAGLSDHTELIELPDTLRQLTFDDVVRAAASPDRRHGIYLLARGDLSSRVVPDSMLSDVDFPILWADVPGFLVLPKQRFELRTDKVKVFRIEPGGIMALPRARREAFRRAVLRSVARSCFAYDAFISYTSHDATEAQLWAAELRSRGLRVFMDEPTSGAGFVQAVNDGLKHSLALVPMISSNVVIRDLADNWVAREVNARKTYFPNDPQIFPVVFGEARPHEIVSGFTPIKVGADRTAAIDKLVEKLAELRDGRLAPPHHDTEVSDVTLE